MRLKWEFTYFWWPEMLHKVVAPKCFIVNNARWMAITFADQQDKCLFFVHTVDIKSLYTLPGFRNLTAIQIYKGYIQDRHTSEYRVSRK